MTSGNAELNDEFNQIALKIRLKVKMVEKKTTFARENWKNLWISQEKIHFKKKRCLQEKICKKFSNFTRENSLNWKSKDNWKWRIQGNSIEDRNRRKKNDIWKRKLVKIGKNFRISPEKIHWIGFQTTSANEEFNDEFNEIRLTIEIEVKMGEEEQHLKAKICKIWKKFHNFRRENSVNWKSNDKWKCTIQRNSIEDPNRSKNGRKKRHFDRKIRKNDKKFHNFIRENSLNWNWNDK